MIFGNKIRELRDEQGLLQRQLAAALEIDTPMFSKIERGDRRAKREQVVKLAELLHQDENEMLKLWLADKVIDAVGDENDLVLKCDAIEVAQKTIIYDYNYGSRHPHEKIARVGRREQTVEVSSCRAWHTV